MATNPATPEFDAATQKWLTYNNNRNGKLEKLQEDNNKLKAEMAKLKATHSRIRRIPKKDARPQEEVSQQLATSTS